MIISASTDYRAAAQRRLPPFLFHYIDGGAYAEHTLNRQANSFCLLPPLLGESERKTRTLLISRSVLWSSPLLLPVSPNCLRNERFARVITDSSALTDMSIIEAASFWENPE